MTANIVYRATTDEDADLLARANLPLVGADVRCLCRCTCHGRPYGRVPGTCYRLIEPGTRDCRDHCRSGGRPCEPFRGEAQP